MNNVKEFVFPETVEEAVEVLSAEDIKSVVVAGNTDIGRSEQSNIDKLVDINRLGLSYIKEDGDDLIIGATTTMAEISASDLTSSYAGGLLAEAAGRVGTTPLRNMVTIGGNISQLRVWSDMPVALLALGAEIKTSGPSGENTYSAEEFFEKHPRQLLDVAELVTEVVLPASCKNCDGYYIKFNKVENMFSTATVAVSLNTDSGKCDCVRIAIGAVGPRPVLCKAAAEKVSGEAPSDELFDASGKIARENATCTGNVWGSEEYKSILVERLVSRALKSCAADK